MGKFTVIPQNAFQALQMDAGVLLKNFNPASPAAPADSDIICATTGGIQVSCVPTYSDFAEDVDNAPVNLKEFKHLDGWECTLTTTSLGTSPELIKLSLGAADIDGTSKIVPRKDLEQADFANLWWVGDRADGGLVAVKVINALSTGGFSIQTTKNGKGQISLTITGHVSINSQSVMPMEFYSMDSTDAYTVTQRLTHVESTFEGSSLATNTNFSATLSAETGYTIANVIVLMNGVDVTSAKYTSGTGVVAIAKADITGDIEIIATANES